MRLNTVYPYHTQFDGLDNGELFYSNKIHCFGMSLYIKTDTVCANDRSSVKSFFNAIHLLDGQHCYFEDTDDVTIIVGGKLELKVDC